MRHLISVGEDRTLKSWKISSKQLSTVEDDCATLTSRYTQLVHEKDVNDVALSPNDKLIATASQDHTAKV